MQEAVTKCPATSLPQLQIIKDFIYCSDQIILKSPKKEIQLTLEQCRG